MNLVVIITYKVDTKENKAIVIFYLIHNDVTFNDADVFLLFDLLLFFYKIIRVIILFYT